MDSDIPLLDLNQIRPECPELFDTSTRSGPLFKHAPFSSEAYSKAVAFDNHWDALFGLTAEQQKLETVFQPSHVRPGGYMLWDRAVAIPACKWREQDPITRNVTPCRKTRYNDFYATTRKELLLAMPLAGGRWRRACGPFVHDLLLASDGWDTLQAAQVMAWHESLTDKLSVSMQERVHVWLCRAVLSKKFGLPFFQGTWDYWTTMDAVTPYGIAIYTSCNLKDPTARIPLDRRGALQPDRTTTVLLAGVDIGKLPQGFKTGSYAVNDATRWACCPVTVAFAGWELADVVTHFPMCSEGQGCYRVHNEDLQTMGKFQELLNLMIAEKGKPNGQTFVEFTASTAYKKLLSCTPAHPLPGMLTAVSDFEAGVVRPRGKLPDPIVPSNPEHAPWVEWQKTLETIRSMVRQSADAYERRMRLQGCDTPAPDIRERASKKLATLLHEIESLTRRYKQQKAKGFDAQARELKERLDEAEERRRETSGIP